MADNKDKDLKEREKLLKEEVEALKKQVEHYKTVGNISEQINNIAEARVLIIEKQNELLKIQIELSKLSTETDEEKQKLHKAQIEDYEDHIEQLEEELKLNEENLETLKEIQETVENITESGKKRETIEKNLREETSKMLGTMFGVDDTLGNWKKKWENSYAYLVLSHMEANDFKDTMKQVAAGAGDFLVNLGPATLEKVFESTLLLMEQQYDAMANFTKQTGMASDKIEGLVTRASGLSSMGVSIGEAVEIMADYNASLVKFDSLSEKQQYQLLETTATMSKLGVATSDLVGINSNLMMSFNMTTDEVERVNKEMTSLAKGSGMTLGKVMSDLNSTLPELAKYGKDATKVFKDLAIQSKALGIETSNLLAITSKFDTWDEGAESVAKFNALLGGDYLNTLELMNLEEGERLDKMVEAWHQSGLNYDMMNKQERAAVAQALGIKDVNEAYKLLGGSLSDYRRRQLEAANSSAMSKEEMEELAVQAKTLGEDIMFILESFAVSFAPVVKMLKVVFTYYAKLDKMIRDSTNGWAGLGVILAGLTTIISALAFAFGLGGETIGRVIEFIADRASNVIERFSEGPLKSLGERFSEFLNSIAGKGEEIRALGLMFLGMGAGIGLAAAGLGYMASQIEGWADVVAVVLVPLAILIPTIYLLGKVSEAAAKGITAVGFAFLMIGIGIGIASVGLAYLVKSFKGLGEDTPYVAAAIVGVSLAMSLMTYALVGAMPALAGFAGTAAVAAAPVLTLGQAFILLGAGIGLAAAGIGIMAWGISTILNSLLKLGDANIDPILLMVNEIAWTALKAPAITYFAGSVATLAISFAMLSAAMSGMNVGAVVSLLQELGKVKASSVTDTFSTLTRALNGFNTSLGEMNFVTLNPLIRFLTEVNRLTTESVQDFEKIATDFDKIVQASERAAATGADMTIKHISEIVANLTQKKNPGAAASKIAGGSGGYSGPKQIVVQLHIDKKKLKDVVVDVANESSYFGGGN